MAFTPTEDLLDQIRRDQVNYLGELHDDLTDLIGWTKKAKSGSNSAGASPKAAPEEEGLIAGLGELAGVIGVVVAAIAAIPAALTAITYTAVPFVNALSPSSIEQFNRAIDDLSATIGYALLPIITYATAAIREWGGILLPTMQELRPIIEELSQAFSELMTGGVRTLAATLSLIASTFGPALSEVAGIVANYAQGLEVLASFVSAISIEFDELGELLNIYRDHVAQGVLALSLFTAMVLKAVGAVATLNKFRDALAKTIDDRANPTRGLAAAPKDSAVTGIEDISRKLNERAFIATAGGTATKTSDELLKDIFDQVEIINNTSSLKDTIKDAIKESFPDFSGRAERAATVVSAVTDDSATSSDRWTAGRESGGLLGGLGAVALGKIGDQF